MPRFSTEQVTQVREANDIVDVIGTYLELKPAGPRHKALCPFHHEKTPSFTVSRDRQMFHCFGCGKGGDVIRFIMDYEGLEFTETLEKLADRMGIRLEPIDGPAGRDEGGASLRTAGMEFLAFAQRFYSSLLAHPQAGAPGREYLAKRGLREATVSRFNLGLAPAGYDNLINAAKKARINPAVLEASGLFKENNSGPYDAFRDRLIFPIHDVMGKTVAFGGRDLSGDSPAKYINSPETLIYKKSRTLYGLRDAREAMRNEQYAILVEGYFDVLRCFDAGIENVVATCGTSLTEGQAKLIRRYVPEVVVLYDGDAAGLKAAASALAILAGAGLNVRATTLPGGQDPDDFIKDQGAEALRQAVANASDFVSFLIEQRSPKSIEERNSVAKEIFELFVLVGFEDLLRRDEYLRLTAKALHLDEWRLRGEFEKHLRGKAFARVVPKREQDAESLPPLRSEDVQCVAAVLAETALLALVRKAFRNGTLPDGALSEVLLALENHGDDHSVLTDELGDEAQRLLAAAANADAPKGEDGARFVAARLASLGQEALRGDAQRVQQEIEEAERAGDTVRMITLIQEKTTIERNLRSRFTVV